MPLYNQIDRRVLKDQMLKSIEKRVTLSFYKYHRIEDPKEFRDDLYTRWQELGVLGRVYVAREGINAQISVPEKNFETFKGELFSIPFLNQVRLNIAIEDDGKSFFKLKIKVRPKIVADGLNDDSFDPADRGTHLDAEAFNVLTDQPETVVVDMRNHYESEVGHFAGAICPDVDTFREALPLVEETLADQRDKPVVMYCTGGIRCEKASAWLKHRGFTKVYQLDGGIIQYAREVQSKGLPNKFRGKNFVFDERLGERISEEVIANCHQCGQPYDTHTNCRNETCNLLFIQCPECAKKYEGCCSEECRDFARLPEHIRREKRKGVNHGVAIFSKGRFQSIEPSCGG